MADDSVFVRFGGSLEGLTAAVDGARASIESLAALFTGLQSSIGGIGEALAAAFAIHEIDHFVESIAALGTQTSRASQILGVSTEEVGALDLIAKASGTSLEQLQIAFGQLSKKVVNETDETKRALAALGLSFTDIKNLTPTQQLELFAEKLSAATDGEQKNAIVKALLGRAAQDLIPLFNQGAEGMRHWADVQKELNPAFERNVAGMHEMHEAIVEMNAAIEGMKVEIFERFKSVLMGAVQTIKDLASSFTYAMEENATFRGYVDLTAGALKILLTVIDAFIAGLKELWAVGVEAAQAVSAAWTTAWHIIYDAFTFNFSDVKNQFSSFGASLASSVAQARQSILSADSTFMKEREGLWGSDEKKIEDQKNMPAR